MRAVAKFELSLFKKFGQKELVFKKYSGYVVFDETFNKTENIVGSTGVINKDFGYKGYVTNDVNEVLMVTGQFKQAIFNGQTKKQLNMQVINMKNSSSYKVKYFYDPKNNNYYGSQVTELPKVGYKVSNLAYEKDATVCEKVYADLDTFEKKLTPVAKIIYDNCEKTL